MCVVRVCDLHCVFVSTYHVQVLWFFGVLFFDFNPYPKIAEYTVVKVINKLMGFGVSAKMGRWYLEREKIYGIIREKVKERGIESFHLPEQAKGLRVSIHAGAKI
jgi:hypothetical protein